MPVCYEVTLEVEPVILESYLQWLADHIHHLLKLDGFTRAQLWQLKDERPDHWVGLVVQYHLRDQDDLTRYLRDHAASFRAEGERRFGGHFRALRRILIHPQEFSL